MTDNMQLAKELFLKYSGSHFQMNREGEYEKYKNFGVSSEQEQKWIEELLNSLFDRAKNEGVIENIIAEMSRVISQYKRIDWFEVMYKIISNKWEKGDSFSQIRIAEEVYQVIDSFKNTNDKDNIIFIESKQKIISVINKIINEPIIVNEYHKNNKSLQGLLTDDKIKKRAQNLMRAVQ